jgi:hypothetical protein
MRKRVNWMLCLLLAIVLTLSLVGAISVAASITDTWDGTTGDWSDAAHWIPTPPGSPVVPNNTATTFDVVVNGGTVTQDFVSGVIINNLNITNGQIANNGAITANGPNSMWTGGTLSGSGTTAVPVDSTLNVNLSISATLAGQTLESAGTINFSQVTSGPTWRLINGTINNLAGGKFTASATSPNADDYLSNISGTNTFNNAGTFYKTGGNTLYMSIPFNNAGYVGVQGGGTLHIDGAFTQTTAQSLIFLNGGTIIVQSGNFVIQAGTIEGVGTIAANVTTSGVVSLVQPDGALMVNGSLFLQSGAQSVFALGGTTPGQDYEQLQVRDGLDLNGTLVVQLASSGGQLFSPHAGDSFDLLDWGRLTGEFSAIQLPALGSGLAWNTSQLYTSGVLSVFSAASLPGDYNHNGVVDAADYTVWRDGLGTTYTQADYTVWKTNFGNHAGGGSSASSNAAVPEPACLLLLLSGTLTICSRRCQKGR